MTTEQSPRKTAEAIAADRAMRRLVWRIVSALEATFQIPPGDHLVVVLGEGTENNNRQALFSWIARELSRLTPEAADQHVPLLAERLNRTLTAWDIDRYSS